MKRLHEENYYRDHWDEMLKPTWERHFMNLEEKLDEIMEPLKEVLPQIGEEKAALVTKAYASMIAEKAFKEIQGQEIVLVNIENGRCDHLYTSLWHKDVELSRMKKRYEFNVVQLKDFKKNHGIAHGIAEEE